MKWSWSNIVFRIYVTYVSSIWIFIFDNFEHLLANFQVTLCSCQMKWSDTFFIFWIIAYKDFQKILGEIQLFYIFRHLIWFTYDTWWTLPHSWLGWLKATFEMVSVHTLYKRFIAHCKEMAGNQGKYQNFDPSILPYKFGLIFMEMKQKN